MSRRSVRAVAAQARIELLLTLRRGESLVVSLAIPVGILVFFTKVDVVRTSLRDPVQFLVPGVLALAVMSTAMVSLGIATVPEVPTTAPPAATTSGRASSPLPSWKPR